MTKQYQWRAATKFNSDTPLSYGVTPNDKDTWQTADIGTGESAQTFNWWFRDSNTPSGGVYTDDISSRVVVSITESWTTSVDNRNRLSVTATLTINSIVRDDIRGAGQDLPARVLNFYKTAGGPEILSLTDNLIATAHTLRGEPFVVGQVSFVIEPGSDAEHSSLFLHNQSPGYPSYDDIWMGIQFRNILPEDYRPGATRVGNVWLSHNRSAGAAKIYTGNSWLEMRTLDGGTGADNRPRIQHQGGWKNMRLIGNE